MNPKKILFQFLFFSSAIIFAGDKKEPLFRASYDSGFVADKSAGARNGKYSAEEVNFETLASFLRKGISGKSMFSGISGEGVDQKRFFCEYEAVDNLSLKQGTVLFWVKPLDWSGSDKDFHVFFCAENKNEWMLVYKFGNSNDLLFLLGPKGKDEKDQWKWTVARANIKDWQMNQWHFIACVWDDEFIKLYVDGKFINQKKIKIKPAGPFEKIIVGDIGRDKWSNIKGSSLIDELEIFDSPLNSEEIYAAFLKLKNESTPTGKVRLKTGKKKPKIDGVIEKWEYSFAGTGFFNLKGNYALTQSKYSVSYDDENIYIGVVSPKLDEFYDKITERDGAVFRDDSVEVFLMPDPASNNYFQFIFNSNGALFDAKKVDSSWNAAESIKIANAFLNNKWTLEAAIPFKAIGVAPPADGTKWKINICRSYPGISLYTAMSPVRQGYHEFSNFAELVFSSDAPLIDIFSIAEKKGMLSVDLKVAAKGRSLQKELLVKSEYKNDGKTLFKSEKKMNLSGENAKETQLKSPMPFKYDNGVLDIDVLGREGETSYSSAFHFAKETPIKVNYFMTDIKKRVLKTFVSHNTPIPSGNEYSISVSLLDKDGKAAASVSVHPEKLIYAVNLPIESVAPGDYEIKVLLSNKKGQTLYEGTQEMAIPSVPVEWMGNKIGITDDVPAPWSALKVDGETVECWGRKYSFGKNIFPSQITTQNQKLLAEPVSLYVDGKKMSEKNAEVVFSEKKDNEVRFSAQSYDGKISATTKNLIEYDGFLWIEMELEVKEPMKVKSIALEIPLEPSCATLVHSMKKGYMYRQPGSGEIPKSGWSKNLFKKPIFWVGNEDVGIQWFAENLKGWTVQNKDKSVEIIPEENKTTVKLNLIDRPVTLSGKRSIAFGLMATPVKPKLKDWRQIRLCRNVQPWFQYNKLFNYPDKGCVSESYPKKLSWHKGQKVCYYHALYMISPFMPEWPYWCERWSLVPPPLGSYAYEGDPAWAGARVCLNSESYRDFYIWKLAGIVKELNIRHLYFDLGVPRECRNENHGCGWKDHKGAIYNSYNILGTRALAKRIYVMMKKHNPEALILNHMSEEPAMPVLSFADLMVDGELYCKQVGEDKSYYNVFSPEWFRAEFMSRQWGPASSFIPQFKRSAQLYVPGTEKFWDTPQAIKPYRHFTGYLLVHDAKCWPNFGLDFKNIWTIQDKFGWDEKLQFIPYWDKNSPLKVLNPKNPRIMASLYLREGKAMVIIMNDTDNDETVKFEFDPQVLNSGAISNVKDAENESRITPKGKIIDIPVPAREFKILFIE